MRHSVLGSLLEIVEQNARRRGRILLFEIGPVFLASEASPLPEEQDRLALVMSGVRMPPTWQAGGDSSPLNFYDLKGVVEELFGGLNLSKAAYRSSDHPSFHPGKRARVLIGESQVGVIGEIHPQVHANYDLAETPVLAAEFDLAALYALLPDRFDVVPLPLYPAVLEDLAIIVDEALSAEQVSQVIREAGGRLLINLRLFDVFRGEQIGAGKKSLAYSLEYQAEDRTLTDQEVLKVRQRIEQRLKEQLDAAIRSQ